MRLRHTINSFTETAPINLIHMKEILERHVYKNKEFDLIDTSLYTGGNNPLIKEVYKPSFFGVYDNLGIIRCAAAGNKTNKVLYKIHGTFLCKRVADKKMVLLRKLYTALFLQARKEGTMHAWDAIEKNHFLYEFYVSLNCKEIKKRGNMHYFLFNL